LYKNGFKNRLDLEKAKIEKLAKIDKIGLTIANNIKAELTKIRY
jgi:helicase